MRASGSDDTIKLIPPKFSNFGAGVEHINDDELVEVTPAFACARRHLLIVSNSETHVAEINSFLI